MLMTIRALSDEAFVMLDPSIEMLDAEIAEYRFICHTHFQAGMAVPPGEGLCTFVSSLMERPVNVAVLREEYDDQPLVDNILASLYQYGFLYVTSQTKPSIEELAHLRNDAERIRSSMLRRFVSLDLDVNFSINQLCAILNAEKNPPELVLRCARLADHKTTLATLAELRQSNAIHIHHTVLQATDLTCDVELCQSLIRFGASVNLEGVSWPAPTLPVAGLPELTRHCVAVHAVMAPNLSILDREVRRRFTSWAGSVFISGLRLKLEADSLWPAAPNTEEAFVELFDAVRSLEEEFGDVEIANLPSDNVLLGATASSSCDIELSELANRFRKAYLRWRIPVLKSFEIDNPWSQIPEVEDKLVALQEDLLPNHPELMLLRPGSVVVDVCGGLGRVARRLAPAVGDEGLIISIEMLRCLTDRAQKFAGERNVNNVHFRTGLAQRLPLPDCAVDAAVNEWSGGIWELGLGSAMVREMARVVRPGGRIAVSHRLIQIPLTELAHPWVQYEHIYTLMLQAFEHPELAIITQRVWGQIVPSLIGEKAAHWRKQYLPRVVSPHDVVYQSDASPGAKADVFLTIVAQRRSRGIKCAHK